MADINLSRAIIVNYTLVRGDTFAPGPVSLSINGTPEDFNGSTLKMQVKLAGKLQIQLVNGQGIEVDGNAVQYYISAADMASWSAGVYDYDVQKTTGDVIVTIQVGKILLAKDVTV